MPLKKLLRERTLKKATCKIWKYIYYNLNFICFAVFLFSKRFFTTCIHRKKSFVNTHCKTQAYKI